MKLEETLYKKIWDRKKTKELKIDKGSRVDVALKLLEKGERLLDIGCGDGMLGYLVKKKYKTIYGLDLSEEALRLAKEKGVITTRTNLNENNLPFEDNYFDAIVCLDVIEHLFEPETITKEIYRVLKPNGLLIITTPNIRYWRFLIELALKGRFPKTSGDFEHYDGGHLHYFTYRDITNLLKKYDLTIRGEYSIGNKFLKEFFSPGVVIKARKR